MIIYAFRQIIDGQLSDKPCKSRFKIVETDLNFGEVDTLVENIKTGEEIYTNKNALIEADLPSDFFFNDEEDEIEVIDEDDEDEEE